MAHYRIYLLDGCGYIFSGSDSACDGDKEACALAQQMLDGHGQAEVWEGQRCVGRVSTHSVAEIGALGRFPVPE